MVLLAQKLAEWKEAKNFIPIETASGKAGNYPISSQKRPGTQSVAPLRSEAVEEPSQKVTTCHWNEAIVIIGRWMIIGF